MKGMKIENEEQTINTGLELDQNMRSDTEAQNIRARQFFQKSAQETKLIIRKWNLATRCSQKVTQAQ
jgi:hypothetical protein